MNCAEFERCLHPFIDAELDVAAQVAAQEHASQCPSCAAAVAHYRQLGTQIRAASTGEVPASLLRRVEELQRAGSSRDARPRRPGLLTAAAAVLLLACGGAWWVAKADRLDSDDVREIVDLHHRSELPGHLVDLETADADQLTPWFSRKIPFTPWIGHARGDYSLVGARLDYCDDQVVAVIVLKYHQHIVNVVSYPSERSGDRSPATARSKDVSLCGWSQAGIQVFVASDLPDAEVRQIAEWLRG